MFGYFKTKRQKAILMHTAGATVVHKSPFDNLKTPYHIDTLSQDFIKKWGIGFYRMGSYL